MNGCNLDSARLKMRADRAAGTEKSVVQVSMCAGTCRPQSRFSHASILGDCRAPKNGVSVPVKNPSNRRENTGYQVQLGTKLTLSMVWDQSSTAYMTTSGARVENVDEAIQFLTDDANPVRVLMAQARQPPTNRNGCEGPAPGGHKGPVEGWAWCSCSKN